MKRVPAILLGVIALLLAAALPEVIRRGFVAPAPGEKALTAEQVFARASRSVVQVYAADISTKLVGRGSGVVVQDGVVATHCHVIARGTTIRVRYSKRLSEGVLLAYDVDRDICLIAVQALDATPAEIGDTSALAIGQRVYAIGTPEGFELTLSEGLISGLRRSRHGRYIQTTAPISDGSSGGGLFDTRGRLIGLTSFVYSAGQNLNFAAPADWAAELMLNLAHVADAAAGPVELPPGYASQWRHPLLE